MIYFDHNATTPMLPEVIEAMHECMASKFANPSSLHAAGRLARAEIDKARETLAEFVNAHPSQVIFTSGGTESNNLALKGCVEGMRIKHFACSAIEHPSVLDVSRQFSSDVDVTVLDVKADGSLDLENFKQYCASRPDKALISVMHANNETGLIQNIAEVASVAKSSQHILHTDAVQALGKITVDFRQLDAHLLSLSAHKLNGPKGIGALIYDKAVNIKPLLHGGGQEKGLRSGTENVAAIVGFAKAVEIAKQTYEQKSQHILRVRNYLEEGLRKLPGVEIFAEQSSRLPNTIFFGTPGIDGETLLMQFDSHDIALTSGSACSSKSGKPSHVLMAMGVDETLARSAIRISLGADTTREEADKFLYVLGQQV
ncbi:MAG: cysteine desulfurase family protein, partial [Gammaproteobacteria bacterium]|nr:cysteine desulfurase family protein [Gammaproteobacteria bacterium]